MVGKVIVSHGGLAEELLRAAETIAGPLACFRAVSLDWQDCGDEARARIAEAIRAVDNGEGVLILADMFGDTPCNAGLALLEPDRVELISGINLPLVVRLGCMTTSPEGGLRGLAEWARIKAVSAIRIGSEVVNRSAGGESAGAVEPSAKVPSAKVTNG